MTVFAVVGLLILAEVIYEARVISRTLQVMEGVE